MLISVQCTSLSHYSTAVFRCLSFLLGDLGSYLTWIFGVVSFALSMCMCMHLCYEMLSLRVHVLDRLDTDESKLDHS